MPLHIVRNDITKMQVDAIVNAANSSLLGGGGVDGCIHRAAGPELLKECRALGGCETGSAKITGAGRLPCRYVIHAVGPRWRGGKHGEREQLISCYRTALELAREYGCETVAFPLISSGIYGYPKDQALKVAVDTIGDFLLRDEEQKGPATVYLVIFDRKAYQIGTKLFADISEYVDDRYVEEHSDDERLRLSRSLLARSAAPAAAEGPASGMAPTAGEWSASGLPPAAEGPGPELRSPVEPAGAASARSLEEALSQLDESFSEMLLRKIDEKGMKDSACYKKANIDRKLFSKIRSDRLYRPRKSTALAFAVALELSLPETKELLMKAGYALSHASRFDIIVEYFIERGNYNIFEINEALFAFDQSLLGS